MKRRAVLIVGLLALLASPAAADPPAGKGPGTAQGNGPGGNGPPGQAGSNPPGPAGTGHPGLAPALPPPPDAPNQDDILSPEGEVTIGSDQNIALDAVKAGLALPLIEIERRAIARWGGRILDARPYRVGNALLYRLTLISNQGVSRRVLVDARNGNPVGSK